MKILVPIKKTIDYSVHVELTTSGTIPDEGLKKGINPFCEIALEQAVRWQEQNSDIEIIVTTIGPQSSQDILRRALAFGANQALLIQSDEPHLESLHKAKILAQLALKLNVDCLFLGKQSIDSDHNHIGQMISAILDWEQAPFSGKASPPSHGQIHVAREVDDGILEETIKLPAVLTSDLRLNEPRFIALPKIIQAKAKPITTLPASDLINDYQTKLKVDGYERPTKQTQGLVTDDIDLFIKHLKEILS